MNEILLAAGWQDWSVKPGEYRLRGAVSLAVVFGSAVLDPEKPTRPPPKQADKRIPAPLRVVLKVRRNADLRTALGNAPDSPVPAIQEFAMFRFFVRDLAAVLVACFTRRASGSSATQS